MLEAQLRQSQKMESVGQLAAEWAHDINNILTVIQDSGVVAQRRSAGCRFDKINKANFRGIGARASFIRQLLTFSRKQIFDRRFSI